MSGLDLRHAARLLGGEPNGRGVLCPGPGHGPKDRSLSVSFDPNAPDGFVVTSFASDDFRACRDHVRERLGLKRDGWKDRRQSRARPAPVQRPPSTTPEMAMRIWAEGVDPRVPAVERYFERRGLLLPEKLANGVLRWHGGVGALLALFRDIVTNAPRAISRTFLTRDGVKRGRMFLGPVSGCAIKLDADEDVTLGLFIAEGIETAMSAREFGLTPVWACGAAIGVAKFPVVSGIESLTILADVEESGAGLKAAREAEARWHEAGRECRVFAGEGDINDALIGEDLS